MRDHTRLKAFQLADSLALEIYETTGAFPQHEIYGLTSQMRRAAVSVPSNIVEGCARHTQSDYVRFLEIAFGSLRELRNQFSLSVRLGYVRPEHVDLDSSIEELEWVLGALIRSLR
jgi:four helix bundle protein